MIHDEAIQRGINDFPLPEEIIRRQLKIKQEMA